MKKNLYTLDEANALLPYLNERMTRLKDLKSQIDTLLTQTEGLDMDFEELFKSETLDETQAALRQNLERIGDEINDILYEIQEKGVVVKDIDAGLVDFFSQFGEQTVYLCWKHGETEIRYWHGVNEGFAQRKSLMERRFLEQVTKLH